MQQRSQIHLWRKLLYEDAFSSLIFGDDVWLLGIFFLLYDVVVAVVLANILRQTYYHQDRGFPQENKKLKALNERWQNVYWRKRKQQQASKFSFPSLKCAQLLLVFLENKKNIFEANAKRYTTADTVKKANSRNYYYTCLLYKCLAPFKARFVVFVYLSIMIFL